MEPSTSATSTSIPNGSHPSLDPLTFLFSSSLPNTHHLPAVTTSTMPLSLLLLLLLLLLLNSVESTRFDFGTLTPETLKLLGDAHLDNGTLCLSRDLPVPTSAAGRALYARPILLPISSFSTFFSFSISHRHPPSDGAGFAFLLASDDHSIGDPDGFLGLVKKTTNVSTFPSPNILAVEFDTMMDVELGDVDGNHVGIDINSVVSTHVAKLDLEGVNLKSGDLVNAWLEYNGYDRLLRFYVSYSTVRPVDPVISFEIDLGRVFGDLVFVGFSGSTQRSTERHCIEWWSFASSSIVLAAPPPLIAAAPSVSLMVVAAAASSRGGAAVVGAATTAGVFFVVACIGVSLWVTSRRSESIKRAKDENLVVAAVRTPREFGYKELIGATDGFDPTRIVGGGTRSAVYRGVLCDGTTIAVKRCPGSCGNCEVSIVAGLRHRHIVKLQGWCNAKNETLLVYDYISNGSLETALVHGQLSWRRCREVLASVASALAYLHRECEHRIIHGNVNSGNVLLDEDFQARLGGFSHARHGGSSEEKADVHSFGVVILEVVSGRRADHGNLVEWAWRLHDEGRAMDVIDTRITEGWEEVEVRRVVMVGLACTHPVIAARPGMRAVVQMLTGEAEVPDVARSRAGPRSERLLLISSEFDNGLCSSSDREG